MGEVVQFSDHQAVKQHQIEEQTKRAEQALLMASKEFQRLQALKHPGE